MEFRFKRPIEIDSKGAAWDSVPTGNWFDRRSTDELTDTLRGNGYDGVVFRNVRDAAEETYPSTKPSDVFHALERGTVYSPLTGDLLYSNGGRQGAAAGAAVGGLDPATQEVLRRYGLLGNDPPSKPSWNAMMRPGDA